MMRTAWARGAAVATLLVGAAARPAGTTPAAPASPSPGQIPAPAGGHHHTMPLSMRQSAPPLPASAALDAASLRAAFLSGEPDQIRRAGRRAAARRLGPALGAHPSDRVLALAAAAAAPWAEDAPWLLRPLAAQATSPDRPLAVAAARAAVHIADNLDRSAELTFDLPLDWLRARLAQFRALADDRGRWTDVRVLALEAATHLARSLGDQAGPDDAPYDLTALLADPDPELRRAALELTASPLSTGELTLVARQLVAEPDPLVALVAGQVACDGLAFGDPAGRVLSALGARGIARLQALVPDRTLPLAARLGAGQCLRADGSHKSRAALAALGHRLR